MPAQPCLLCRHFRIPRCVYVADFINQQREEALVHQKLRDAAYLENSASDQSVFGERKTFYDAALSSAFQRARGLFARS